MASYYNTESLETTDNSPALPDPTKRLFTALSTWDPITGKMGGGLASRVMFPFYNVKISPHTNLTWATENGGALFALERFHTSNKA